MFCVAGSVLAASAPAFIRDLHASRLTEAVDGVSAIAAGAVAYSNGKELAASFPPAVRLTPETVPRGEPVTDPAATWDHPTWQALGFRKDGPHYYSFAFEPAVEPARIMFRAVAQGDLNGDGIFSTFEVVGERRPGQPQAVVLPGMNVYREVE